MNPDNHKKLKHRTFINLIKRSYFLILAGKWSRFGKYILTDTVNILNQYNLTFKKKYILCPICNYKNHSFVHLSNSYQISWNSSCQNCDSRSRHRGLYFLYKNYLTNSLNKKILHFAPEKNLANAIKKFGENRYYTTDYNMTNVDFPNEDVQALNFESNSFDIIFINHVLEHVRNDNQALKEISRILKNNGYVIITIPGNWKRMKTKVFVPPTSNGHYRDYGIDVLEKLQNHFNLVKKINLFKFHGEKHAIKKLETAFVCKK